MVIHEGTDFPPEKSAEGSNAFYHRCAVVGYAAPYCGCLLSIKRVESGERKKVQVPACVEAIDRGVCPSVAMKREEAEAGVALYYKPRAKVVLPPSSVAPSRPRPPVAKKPAAASLLNAIGGNGYADAINKALADHRTASTTPPEPTSQTSASKSQVSYAGKSLLEIARMRAAGQ
jgi:hypothetical protein